MKYLIIYFCFTWSIYTLTAQEITVLKNEKTADHVIWTKQKGITVYTKLSNGAFFGNGNWSGQPGVNLYTYSEKTKQYELMRTDGEIRLYFADSVSNIRSWGLEFRPFQMISFNNAQNKIYQLGKYKMTISIGNEPKKPKYEPNRYINCQIQDSTFAVAFSAYYKASKPHLKGEIIKIFESIYVEGIIEPLRFAKFTVDTTDFSIASNIGNQRFNFVSRKDSAHSKLITLYWCSCGSGKSYLKDQAIKFLTKAGFKQAEKNKRIINGIEAEELVLKQENGSINYFLSITNDKYNLYLQGNIEANTIEQLRKFADSIVLNE
jgi:hypothetical protein